MSNANANAWGLLGVLEYFKHERKTSDQVYGSEWFFLKDRLKEGISVLDVGCAQGGFASILGEHIEDFSYTGIDINAHMIDLARDNHKQAEFHLVEEGDMSVLGDRTFDLVLLLGILHLHERWRDTLTAAWNHTGGSLLADLREVPGPTVEDKTASYFQMNFGGDDTADNVILPYNLINAGEALAAVETICADASNLSHYGYRHPVSSSAVTPINNVMTNVYCMERS
jgi:2-polyprenyl-3-methyl-5-hydroxy-6-metoxy-1,4-benzoquinol methylase